MKTFTTILIVILTVVLGRWLTTTEPTVTREILMGIYSVAFITVFSYGIYKILEYFEK